ncbi:hypothetical protein CYY_000806 [Polysphondylium violaceum]|uniref:Uncharacterized protein n=1 Tax=Polysphondylium violaceum TaxID=133409 RepID=A0A8J4Q453_9MYCE|nr:hypothetical protein CYY_000806 [Polysphondylium violaceum]
MVDSVLTDGGVAVFGTDTADNNNNNNNNNNNTNFIYINNIYNINGGINEMLSLSPPPLLANNTSTSASLNTTATTSSISAPTTSSSSTLNSDINNSQNNMVNDDDNDSSIENDIEEEQEEPLEFIIKFRYPKSTEQKVVITRLKRSLCFNNIYPYHLRDYIPKNVFIESIRKINSKSHRPFYFIIAVHCILLLFCLGLLLVGLLPRINKVSIVIFTALIVVSFFYFIYDLLVINSRYLQNIELELDNLNTTTFQSDSIEWKLVKRSFIDFHRKKVTKLWIEINLPENGPVKSIDASCLSFSDIAISFDPNEIPIVKDHNYYYSMDSSLDSNRNSFKYNNNHSSNTIYQ